MSFDALHPAVQHHIVNSLRWPRLRPLQELAISPILEGQSALLLAPTAGGKTEAAILPVLSRMLSEDWRGMSVLYVCPIKALLNNLEPRLAYYTGLVGRRANLWHGDVAAGARKRILGDPPDVLLATPESLEVQLTSSKVEQEQFFANVRAVIVDEIHAFAGDDRGWHLLAVIERIARLSTAQVQRLGLSATVGNPEVLLDWLTARRETSSSVVMPPPDRAAATDVGLDYVGSIPNAATVISRLHRGEKRLVFCDSRSQVEALASELRRLGVATHVSHSSLSVDERRQAEAAFASGTNCVIVATSTLELGIDVGDLDRVIQIDAPATVAAFLQRLGRTGRRPGTQRNCLFLATRPERFLQAAGLLRLWGQGFVEPVTPPPLPFHVLAQQIMTLLLQLPGATRNDLLEQLVDFLEVSGIAAEDAGDLVDHMLREGFLAEDSGLLALGPQAEKQFGHKHYITLFSVFDSPPLFTVFYGREELGQVHPLSFQRKDQNVPVVLSLGGRAWKLRSLDWNRKAAWVEPGEDKGKSRWSGEPRPLGFDLCQSMAAVLRGDEVGVRLSKRAEQALEELQYKLPAPQLDETLLIRGESASEWWTYAGGLANAALAAAMREKEISARADSLMLAISSPRAHDLLADALQASQEGSGAGSSDRSIKFRECLPERDLERMVLARDHDARALHAVRTLKLSQLVE